MCSGWSPVEDELRRAVEVMTMRQSPSADDHVAYFTHPLRSLPYPLLPTLYDGSAASWLAMPRTLSTSTEFDGRTWSHNALHAPNLLDMWIDAVRSCSQGAACEEHHTNHHDHITLVVDAQHFKTFERWATSRRFPLEHIISNGRTGSNRACAADGAVCGMMDLDLALQHLNRSCPQDSQAAQNTRYVVGFLGAGRLWPVSVTALVADLSAHVKTTTPLALMSTARGCVKLLSLAGTALTSLIEAFDVRMEKACHAASRNDAPSLNIVELATHVGIQLDHMGLSSAFGVYPSDETLAAEGSLLQQYVNTLPDATRKENAAWWTHLVSSATVTPTSPEQRSGVIRARSYARVGVMGNPSDQLHGKSAAVSITNFWADVYLFPSRTVRLLPNPVTDPCEFSSLDDLYSLSASDGYSGGLRLLQAACKRFYQFCRERSIPITPNSGFTLYYETNVPRQVGLAGSSCIVTAVLKALLAWNKPSVSSIPTALLPTIALQAEMEELKIHAGLMDRVVQMYDGFIFMDFTDAQSMKSSGHATYRRADATRLPNLHLAYAIDPSDSGRMHSDVKQRWANGDKEIIDAAVSWAKLVDDLIAAESTHSIADVLGPLMDQNFNLRRRIYGDACLGWKNLRMVDIARSHGAHAKFPGSGGAILLYCDPRRVESVWKLKKAMYAEGFVLIELQFHQPDSFSVLGP